MAKEYKVSNKEFWEEKYISGHMPWDIGQVAPAFINYFTSHCEQSKAMTQFAVLGCGRGHDAFYIAKLNENFEVYGFDFVEGAIQYCKKIKQKEKLTNIDFYQVNFFELTKNKNWKNHFDYVIEHTSLAAIDPNKRKEYVQLVKFLLKPNGKLVGLFFVRLKEAGGPPFGIAPEEVRELFKEVFKEVEELHLEPCLHTNLKGDEWLGVFERK